MKVENIHVVVPNGTAKVGVLDAAAKVGVLDGAATVKLLQVAVAETKAWSFKYLKMPDL